MDLKFPAVTDTDLTDYYWRVPDSVRAPLVSWAEYFQHWFHFHFTALRSCVLDEPAGRQPAAAVNYIKDDIGRHVFAWIYKVNKQPRFGEEAADRFLLNPNGKALKCFWDWKSNVGLSPTADFPPMYAGSTGALGIPPPNPGDKATTLMGHYLFACLQIDNGDGIFADYARILPYTLFSRSVLEWVQGADTQRELEWAWRTGIGMGLAHAFGAFQPVRVLGKHESKVYREFIVSPQGRAFYTSIKQD